MLAMSDARAMPTSKLPRSVYAARLCEFPSFAFANAAILENRGQWNQFFRNRIGPCFDNRLLLEIGCFDARFLSAIATEHPSTAFVGIDWKCKAIYDGAKHIAERDLKNIVLLRAPARDLLKIFADAEVDEIWVFHPDPCDRESQLKNRLVTHPFLLQVHQLLKNQASLLALKTDHPHYYQSVLDLFTLRNLQQTPGAPPSLPALFHLAATSPDFWHDKLALAHSAGRYFAGKPTLFESRFLKRRQPIHYLELRPATPGKIDRR
jgi:tRNA G46 methylase TrmB